MILSNEVLIKVTFFLLVGVLFLYATPKKTACFRHFFSSTILFLLLLLPVIHPYVPKLSWEIDLMSRMEKPDVDKAIDFLPSSLTTPFSNIKPLHTSSLERPVNKFEENSSCLPKNLETTAIRRPIPLLAIIWLIGCSLLLFRFLWGLLQIHRISSQASLFSHPDLLQILDHIKQIKESKRRPVVLCSEDITTPMTWGVFQPKILLPQKAKAWTGEELTIVLLHEYGHISRSDYLLHLLSAGASIIYWFHPLVWVLKKLQFIERERACDEWVLFHGIQPTLYAEKLLAIAKRINPMENRLALRMARFKDMRKRITHIVNFHPPKSLLSGRQKAFTISLSLSTLGALLIFTPVLANESSEVYHFVRQINQVFPHAFQKPSLEAPKESISLGNTFESQIEKNDPLIHPVRNSEEFVKEISIKEIEKGEWKKEPLPITLHLSSPSVEPTQKRILLLFNLSKRPKEN